MEQQSQSAMPRRPLTVDEYVAGVRAGEPAVLARALTLVESDNPNHRIEAEELLTRLLPFTGGSVRVAVTGAPGVGKSTFIEALGLHLVRGGRRLAVLTVDPSSAAGRGSILADKTRMQRLAAEAACFIRPSPSGGALGGVARRTRECLLVCEAAGYDVVLVETVGVGQSETVAADMTDCFLALMMPGAGDELQGIKRGLLELVDVIAVNKADGANRDAAELADQQFRQALSLFGDGEKTAVLTCSALYEEGVDAVWDAVQQRHSDLVASGELTEQRRRQNLRWMWMMVDEQLRQAIHNDPAVNSMRSALEQAVLDGAMPVEAAARRILEAFRAS